MKKNILEPFKNIQTPNYNLRTLESSDENEIYILRSDERVLQYIDSPKAQRIEDARQFISKIISGTEKGGVYYWAVEGKNEEKLIGTICLWNFSEDFFSADIGFTLLPDYYGMGIMQEVIPAVIAYAFDCLNLSSINGEVAPGNVKSIKLLEKFGFVLNSERENTLVYALQNRQ